jgi:hypothetical protein
MIRKWMGFLLPMALVLPAAGNPPPAYKVETISSCTLPQISDAMKKTLQEQGLRVTGDSGPLCEIWLRKVLPQNAGTGTDYSTLAAGTFVGVIRYLSNGGDYKGQTIKPGTYTMHYQTMPSDGNHMGVAPTPDFFVLLPPSADTDPDAVLDFQELIKLGKQASSISHIYPLYLTSPAGGATPEILQTGDGQWALEAKTEAQPKDGKEIDFPIALVLVGKSES